MSKPIPPILLDYLLHGREEVYLEYKGDVPWTDRKKWIEIVQTIYAMANENGGGTIVVGVEDNGTLTGLSEANFATYSHDWVNQKIQNKTNQPIACKVEKVRYEDAATDSVKNFVFIQIPEVKEFPLVYTGGVVLMDPSKEPFLSNIGLRQSAIYIRSKTSIGNKEIETVQEWQDLIERTHRKYESETIRRTGIIRPEENPFDKELKI